MSRFTRIPWLMTPAALAAIVTAPAGRSAASVVPRLQALYVPMPDGMRLAVDVWLPAGTTAGAGLPTVLEADRYWRARAYSGGYQHNANYYIAAPWNAS
jgi:predicted acyl esterase